MICQILLRMGFGTHADLYPGEVLTSYFGNDGLNAVMAAGRAVATNAQPAGLQGNVVKQNDDPLGWYMEVGGKLQYRATGQIHIGLGLQQKQLAAAPADLAVQTLKFSLVYLAAQLLRQNVQRPETCIVAGLFIFPAGIT